MNIVILTQVYFPDTVSVAQHLHDLCKELANRGHKVTVITSRFVAFKIFLLKNIKILQLKEFGKHISLKNPFY